MNRHLLAFVAGRSSTAASGTRRWETSSTVADTPILLTGPAWRELSALAEAMAAELSAAEQELFERTDLHASLGLPRAVTEALHRGHHPATRALARLVRFDFHHTPDGWRISEANTDVPGGMNEASGLPALVAPCYPSIESIGR